MNVPEFRGEPLSTYHKLTSEGGAGIWQYTSRQTPRPGDMDTLNDLTNQGFEPIGGDETTRGVLLACLFSQLYEVVYVQSGQEVSAWAHRDSIKAVQERPVILCFATPEGYTSTHEIERIEMLQFLPNPHMGEIALVGHGSPRAFNCFDLDSPGQVLYSAWKAALFQLAGPCEWPAYVGAHQFCTSELVYNDLRTELLKISISSQGKSRKQAQEQLVLLEESHKQVVELRASWLRPDWLLQWGEVRRMAQELAASYSRYGTAKINRPVPAIANVFQTGMADMCYALPLQAFTAAAISKKAEMRDGQWSGGDWLERPGEKENDLILSYSYGKGENGKLFVEIQEDATGRAREKVLANMWEQSVKYSDLDSDVYLARFVQLLKGEKDAEGNTWITGQQILRYRGILPKKNEGDTEDHYTGGHRQEDLEKIASCIARQKNITIKIVDMEIVDANPPDNKKRRRGSRTRISRESPLFMEGDIIYHHTLPLDGPSRSIPIAWQYRESSWMIPFLTGPNRFTGKLIETVLHYDPYREIWEKRLAKYFMWWLRTNAKLADERKPCPHVYTLLKELNLDIDERFPQRTRDRFEKAMNRLAQDGLLVWRYKETTQLPGRKWLKDWLNWQVYVTDPPMLQALHTRIEERSRVIRAAELNALNPPKKKRKGKD